MTNAADPLDAKVPRYESRDVSVGLLLAFGVCLCLLIVLALRGTWTMIQASLGQSGTTGAVSAAPAASSVPAPRLQINPPADLSEKRNAEEAVLRTYGWVDRSAGTIRIPIDRAMDILAEREENAREAP